MNKNAEGNLEETVTVVHTYDDLVKKQVFASQRMADIDACIANTAHALDTYVAQKAKLQTELDEANALLLTAKDLQITGSEII